MKKKRLRLSGTDQQNTTSWLTTFNDLVTLLMVFFVLLFSMSKIDEKKIKEVQYSLQSGLGILEAGKRAKIEVKEDKLIDDMSHINTQAEGGNKSSVEQTMQHMFENAMDSLDPDLGIRITYSDQGMRLSLEDCLLFDFGRADINPEGYSFLDKLAGVVGKVQYPIRVEGHTDNVPINTKHFPSNWELSTARAVNVVKYFAATGKIDPRRLSAVGWGESRPVLPNDSPEHRARNRRVEIVLMKESAK